MIERFYLKDFLTFNEVELELSHGLIVFSGPSGSGKSILMESILSSFGRSSCDAAVCESSVTWPIDEEHGIESEEINIFKQLKKEKARYFLNNQSVSKKALESISSRYFRHLSLRDYSDFENLSLLELLDSRIAKNKSGIIGQKRELAESFHALKEHKTALAKIVEQERNISELKEFAAFEIEKITKANPRPDEDEELMRIKKELSKKEKMTQLLESSQGIFEFESRISSLFEMLEVDGAFFDDAMNELRSHFEAIEERFGALEEVDIEDVLNRIEELSEIKRRYGSIEAALEYKEQKITELATYENIAFEKGSLESMIAKLQKECDALAQGLHEARIEALKAFMDDLNSYLKELYLREANIKIEKEELGANGYDKIILELQNTPLEKISTGEFNRLRLAILLLKAEQMSQNGGVLMLDEIDANLSGEESMSVAKVLKRLARYFQIFSISHQPQLTSMGDQHFLIHKVDGVSHAKKLNDDERIEEIARIISGENITKEAKQFAKELLESSRCVL